MADSKLHGRARGLLVRAAHDGNLGGPRPYLRDSWP